MAETLGVSRCISPDILPSPNRPARIWRNLKGRQARQLRYETTIPINHSLLICGRIVLATNHSAHFSKQPYYKTITLRVIGNGHTIVNTSLTHFEGISRFVERGVVNGIMIPNYKVWLWYLTVFANYDCRIIRLFVLPPFAFGSLPNVHRIFVTTGY